VLNTWPATPVTKAQLILALGHLHDFIVQNPNLP